MKTWEKPVLNQLGFRETKEVMDDKRGHYYICKGCSLKHNEVPERCVCGLSGADKFEIIYTTMYIPSFGEPLLDGFVS